MIHDIDMIHDIARYTPLFAAGFYTIIQSVGMEIVNTETYCHIIAKKKNTSTTDLGT